MVKRCLPAAVLAAALLPATLHAESMTIVVYSLEGEASASLASPLVPGSPIGVVALTNVDDAANILVSGLEARVNYQIDMLLFGSTKWNTIRTDVLDPLDGDDGLDTLPYGVDVPNGFSTSNTRDGLSFAQSAGLERSARFAGGSAVVTADENTNAGDTLRFTGVAVADGVVRVTFGLRDFQGGRSFIVRISAEDAVDPEDPPAAHTPEPASMLLLGTGLAGVFAARRRLRREPSSGSD